MSNNTGNTLTDKVGGVVKGIVDVGHGAGEAIRGTTNQTLDQAGEGLNRGTTDANEAKESADAKGRSSEYANANTHQDVSNKGVEEFKQGLSTLGNVFGKGNSSASTTTSATTDATSTTNTTSNSTV